MDNFRAYRYIPIENGRQLVMIIMLSVLYRFLTINLFFISAVFMLICVGTFASRFAEWFPNRDPAFGEDAGKLGWAFGVGACSMCLVFAATGLLLIEMLFGEEV